MDQEGTPIKQEKNKIGLIVGIIIVALVGWYLYANRPAQDKDQTNTNTNETAEGGEVMEKKDVYEVIDVKASDVAFDFDSRFHDGTGRFTTFDAQGTYSTKDPTQMDLKITIDVDSIDTGIGLRDTDLKSENFFNVSKYPTITFALTQATLSEDGKQLTLTGDLTIMETTKSVSAPVTALTNKDGSLTLKGSVTINRRDFGMKDDIKINPVGDQVPIHVSMVFR